MLSQVFINKKLHQYVAYIDEDQMHNSAHATARDCERLLINKIGLYLLLNRRKGGAGRTPKDTNHRWSVHYGL